MKNKGAYRDPTADEAVNRVMKELKRKVSETNNRDDQSAPKRIVVPYWEEEKD